jgi:hypothetical protein
VIKLRGSMRVVEYLVAIDTNVLICSRDRMASVNPFVYSNEQRKSSRDAPSQPDGTRGVAQRPARILNSDALPPNER